MTIRIGQCFTSEQEAEGALGEADIVVLVFVAGKWWAYDDAHHYGDYYGCSCAAKNWSGAGILHGNSKILLFKGFSVPPCKRSERATKCFHRPVDGKCFG